MKETKITKRDKYEALIAILKGGAVDVAADDLVAFCEREIEILDNKKAKGQERAAAKKAEADELTSAVEALLTDEFVTIADITAKIEGIEDVTVHKVANRLSKLVAAGAAEKSEISVTGTDGKKAKRVAYKAVVSE